MKPKVILGLLFFAVVIFVTAKIVPNFFSSYQFQDDVASIVKFAGDKTDETLRGEILKKAESHDVPIKAEDIIMTRNNNSIQVTIDYTITVDLIATQRDFSFHIAAPPN